MKTSQQQTVECVKEITEKIPSFSCTDQDKIIINLIMEKHIKQFALDNLTQHESRLRDFISRLSTVGDTAGILGGKVQSDLIKQIAKKLKELLP